MGNTIARALITALSPFTILIVSDQGLGWLRLSEGQVMLWLIVWSFAWMFYRDSLPVQINRKNT